MDTENNAIQLSVPLQKRVTVLCELKLSVNSANIKIYTLTNTRVFEEFMSASGCEEAEVPNRLTGEQIKSKIVLELKKQLADDAALIATNIGRPYLFIDDNQNLVTESGAIVADRENLADMKSLLTKWIDKGDLSTNPPK